ncbi:MAG: hypothetical protein QX197_04730 [Methylococcaceae bacterium]
MNNKINAMASIAIYGKKTTPTIQNNGATKPDSNTFHPFFSGSICPVFTHPPAFKRAEWVCSNLHPPALYAGIMI